MVPTILGRAVASTGEIQGTITIAGSQIIGGTNRNCFGTNGKEYLKAGRPVFAVDGSDSALNVTRHDRKLGSGFLEPGTTKDFQTGTLRFTVPVSGARKYRVFLASRNGEGWDSFDHFDVGSFTTAELHRRDWWRGLCGSQK
jgi:hypothetical protein